MRVLHVCNYHRSKWGSDRAWDRTIALSREAGIDAQVFSRDSAALPPGLRGKLRAALDAVRPGEAVAAFAETLARLRPDIVHAHELYPLISPWILPACTAAGVPVVQSAYDFRLGCPIAMRYIHGAICGRCSGGREYNAVLRNCRGNLAESAAYGLRNAVARRNRLFLDHVAQYLAPAPYVRDWLAREFAIPPQRVTVHAPVVDLPAEPADAPPPTRDYIGLAARFTPEKGSSLLIEAARRTGLPVRLAGNQAGHPALRPGDPVTCVLTPERGDLARFYRNARFIVVPSLYEETFSLVAAEAMAHGTAVVASRIGALPTTLAEGETALLFEPGDVAGLAAAMRALWDDPARCARMGAAGRRRVAALFSPATHMAQLMEGYEAALARR